MIWAHHKSDIFADDYLLDCPITIIMDQDCVHEDLNSLVEWGNKWGMNFNAPKCNILRIVKSQHPLTWFYTLSGHILDEINEAKYLGINHMCQSSPRKETVL